MQIDIKEQSRQVIAQWLPGSNAEDYVVSADISAVKPVKPVSDCAPESSGSAVIPPGGGFCDSETSAPAAVAAAPPVKG